ncbi:hypothetical protein LguiA_028021 [Lonicera macranthoides]|nr:agamous-like MADS-box protein CMB1 [Lonicera macranthoides]WOW96248.1 agamous-like MADS-box protein CMB1 [Lonicera macranthoides]
MGRGKVEVKRIENKINRQVTFAKRRNGLLKKAYELSLLCDAEVALIIFSNRGKLYEFCSSPSMAKTLERYQNIKYGSLDSHAPQPLNEIQNCYHDYLRLKARVEVLARTQRNLLGEDLGPLNTKELEQLEYKLEFSLKQLRSTKFRFMLDQLAELQRREQMLAEANKVLIKMLEESALGYPLQLSWEAGVQNIPFDHLAPQSEMFFQQHGSSSAMQMGYNPGREDEMNADVPNHNPNGRIPGWMH